MNSPVPSIVPTSAGSAFHVHVPTASTHANASVFPTWTAGFSGEIPKS